MTTKLQDTLTFAIGILVGLAITLAIIASGYTQPTKSVRLDPANNSADFAALCLYHDGRPGEPFTCYRR